MLAKGLSDFSYEAGVLRRNFGFADSDYGPGFGAVTYRRGLTSALTGEGRFELQKDRQAAGAELTGLVGLLGVARGAVAWSRSDGVVGDAASSGGHYLLGFERSAPAGGGSLQWEHFEPGFRQFGSFEGEARPRDRLQLVTGLSLGRGLSAGLSYIRQTTWEADRFSLVAAHLGIALPSNLFVTFHASRLLDASEGWTGGVSLIVPLEKQRSVAASSNRERDGRLTHAVQASQSPPSGPGVGWRLRASDRDSQRLLAGATVNTGFGQFAADASAGRDVNAVRVGALGSVGWLQGLPFAARRIDHGSFAVVKVGDLEGVPVYRSNQLAGITNADGLVLVTGLLPYQSNRLTIDPDTLPLDSTIGGTEEMPVPYARSGVFVDFPVRRSRNALVVLQQPNGDPVPAGARVTMAGSDGEFVVGKRGEAYLTNLRDDNRLTVSWKNGRCRIVVQLDALMPAEPRIGPLTCAGG